jgi:hypothetical protein
MILEGGPYRCYDNYCIVITNAAGVVVDNLFDLSDVGQSFTVAITDCMGSGNTCWGTINVEEKLIPEIECPDDIIILCNQDPNERDAITGELITGELKVMTCEPDATISYLDDIIDNGLCSDPRVEIYRKWTLVDKSGNKVTCNQVITVLPFDPMQVEFPTDFNLANSLNCEDVNEDPTLTEPINTGIPTLNGYPVFGSNFCDINVGFEDKILTDVNCSSAYSILRTWTIENECQPLIPGVNPIERTQRIKVDDNTPPSLKAVDNIIAYLDPWSCRGTIALPEVVLEDNCSDYTVKYNVSYGQVEDGILYNALPGLTYVTAKAKDGCGNTASLSFTINFVDNTPPIAVVTQNLVVSLSTTGIPGEGFAKVYAKDFDNYSHDGCSNVYVEIRRESDNCDTSGNTTYNADGHPEDGSTNSIDPNYDIDNGEYVKFCCSDLTEIDSVTGKAYGMVKVWLRVWDDGDFDGVYGTAGDNYNEAWGMVRVEDKLAPAITCPSDIIITCDQDYEDTSVTGEAVAFGTCNNISVEYQDVTVNINNCGSGFVIRRWNVAGNPGSFCDQRIDVKPVQVFVGDITWPADLDLAGCPSDIEAGEPTWDAVPCNSIGFTVEADTFKFEDGACFKILNYWTVIDWCEYDPNDPNSGGIFTHSQVIKVNDETQPVILTCDDVMYPVDGNCEIDLTLTNAAHDDGSASCPTGWLKWQITVDLWGDGTNDYEFSSFLPANDNQFNDTNGNGIPDRYVPATANDGVVSVTIPEVISGSMSSHKVVWKVTDGCGNVTSCTNTAMIVDKKAPTPYCISVSSAVMENGQVELWAADFNLNSFDNCTFEEDLWYTFDEAHPVLTKTSQSHYFKGLGSSASEAEYLTGNAQKWQPDLNSSAMIFDCEDLPEVEVKMSVWDEKYNTDYCIVVLSLVDNQGACPTDNGAKISGNVSLEDGTNFENVLVYADANIPEYPKLQLTDEAGDYLFNLHQGFDYVLNASHDIEYKNGVTTLDLVLIQRHILGLSNLNSPYKLIASDINNDEKITASDLSQLRKLILGLYENDDLPENESWRFVEKESPMNITNPWPFDELINVDNLTTDVIGQDFIGVKIGDVNNTVTMAGAKANESEERSQITLKLQALDRNVTEGETVTLQVSSADFKEVYGYQFTMNLNGLKYNAIHAEALELNETNVGNIATNRITMSWNTSESVTLNAETILFTISFIAERNGRLSNMISIGSEVTQAESYTGSTMNVNSIDLVLTTEITEEEEVAVYQLYQNEPNPFKRETVISYSVPTAVQATLSIFDVTGKLILTKKVDATKGLNSISIQSDDLNDSGVYYYELRTDDYTDNKKMILIK